MRKDQITNVMKEPKKVFGFSLERASSIATNIYFASVVAAAIFTSISIAAGFIQNKLGDSIQRQMTETISLNQKETARANERAKLLELKEAEQRVLVENARTEAAKASARGDEAKAAAAKSMEHAEQARLEAEALRKQNLELEKAVSPRILEQNLTAQELKKFSDVSFLVTSPSDFEPRRAAGQIRFMLLQAGWMKFSGSLGRQFPFFDGIVVHAATGAYSGRGTDAAKAVVDVLERNGIDAQMGFPIQGLDPSAILIQVGPKPLPKSLQLHPESVPSDARGTKIWGNIAE